VLKSLPAPTITVHALPMTREQVAEEARIVATEKEALKILASLQKLYQHPSLLRKETEQAMSPQAAIEASPKLEECIRILRKVKDSGEKALIFTLWCQMQDLLRAVIQHVFELPVSVVNGASNQSGQSQKILQTFSRREGFDVLIMSPLAAGAGLNVTAANHVIHYGRWWNPAKEDQATARAHRIGQTRDVHVHYLVLHHPDNLAEGFDTKLHDYVTQKRGMATDFLSPTEDKGAENLIAAQRTLEAQ
jgi:SNF2 family DNA or RNA helicase